MRILYVCNGNVARSHEAEYFTRMLAKGQHQAVSAGLDPIIGKSMDSPVVEVMCEAGCDTSSAYRKLLTKAMVDDADAIVSFKALHELPEFVTGKPNVRFF